MKNGLVSVIVPNLNYGETIEKCLNSILNQTYKNLELLIVDGGSIDSSINIIESYARRYSQIKIVSRSDAGQSNAINKGIESSEGEFITWLNSDDYLSPDALEIAVSELEKNMNIGLVYGSVINIGKDGRFMQLNIGQLAPKENIYFHDFIPQAGSVFRASLGMRLDESLNWAMDWDLWIRLSKVSNFLGVNEILGYCLIENHIERKSNQICAERTKELLKIKKKYKKVSRLDIIVSIICIKCGEITELVFRKNNKIYQFIIKFNSKLYRLYARKELMV